MSRRLVMYIHPSEKVPSSWEESYQPQGPKGEPIEAIGRGLWQLSSLRVASATKPAKLGVPSHKHLLLMILLGRSLIKVLLLLLLYQSHVPREGAGAGGGGGILFPTVL